MEIWSSDGVLTMPGSGKHYVIDCVSEKLIPLHEARWIGWSKKYGGPFWIDNGGNINIASELHPSGPKKKEIQP